MGAAAYNRASQTIRQQIAADYPQRPVEFEIIDRLNALEKYPDCGQPWNDLVISYNKAHKLWWVMCAKKRERGFGYYYKTLNEAVKRWNIEIHGIEGEYYLARPLPEPPMTFDRFCAIRGIKF